MASCLLVALFLSSASAQFLFGPSFSGHYMGYEFEYHKSHRVLLVRSFSDCYLIVADNNLEKVIEYSGPGLELKAEILAQIKAGTGLTNSTREKIRNDFHDYLGFIQCNNHNIYDLAFTVTVTSQSPGTTSQPYVAST